MGANPYFYFTPYQADIGAALQRLRAEEFQAGRYDPAMKMVDPPSFMFEFAFPPDETSPSPGAQHDSIDEAIDAGAESGTGSILDIMSISDEPDYSAACRLPPEDLVALFATERPTRELVRQVLIEGRGDVPDLFWGMIDRGQGRYIIVYDGHEPSEIFFAGYSWD